MGSLDCSEMRNFIRLVLLSRCDSDGAVVDPEVYVDFENAQPTEIELEIYSVCEKALEQAETVLLDAANYAEGATCSIRKAITYPEDAEIQQNAWECLIPLVLRLRHYYRFAQRLEQIVPLVLWELCSGPLPPVEQLEASQALAKQFAQILDFVLRFDEIKIRTPSMQNDFSYYRRAMSSKWFAFGIVSDIQSEKVMPVCCEEANTMCLFYAQPSPMLSALMVAIEKFVIEHPQLSIENTTEILGTMATVCRTMAENPNLVERFAKEEETVSFCLRVMVGAIILYDHLHPDGAFARSSIINVKVDPK